jgi:hypothetical protein
MNQKASLLGYDLVIWLIRMIILIGLIVVYLMFSGMMFRTNINVKEGEAYLMMQSLLTNPKGISYTAAGRTYPGIIDMERFSSRLLNDTMSLLDANGNPYPDDDRRRQHWGYRLVILDEHLNQLEEHYWNRRWFHIWKVRAETGLGGSASSLYLAQNYTVQLRYPDRTVPGFLTLEVARPAR